MRLADCPAGRGSRNDRRDWQKPPRCCGHPRQAGSHDKADETDLVRAGCCWTRASGRGPRTLCCCCRRTTRPDGLEQKAGWPRGPRLKAEEVYEEAREIFLSLGDYAGAREQASDCLYLPARKRMEQGDWDGTIEILSGIQDYLNSREMTLECHYHKAEELLAAGDLDGASRNS